MARHNELGRRSLRGKWARGVFAGLFMVLPLTAAPLFARPMQPGAHARFENNQPHLGAWLQRHGNLTPEQQQKAMQNEPGFSRLPPETQQKLLDRLRQINRMPPNMRQRTVDRIEAMESLSPQMRQQVRLSIVQFRTLPEDRQRLVKKALRDLKEYPPEQRAAMMNSGQFRAQFTPQERAIVGNILAVEPYQPAHAPGQEGLQDGR